VDKSIVPASPAGPPSSPSEPASPRSTTDSGPSEGASLTSDSENGLSTHTRKCPVKECVAPPFPTSYLLNSHMTVHSGAAIHFCPEAGCERGPGGMGFKRKNKMIRFVVVAGDARALLMDECYRHRLVHTSTGHFCRFCLGQIPKYPRPDNLQRHIRAHHPGNDRNDPALRAVLRVRS
jgi:hypothetical protein